MRSHARFHHVKVKMPPMMTTVRTMSLSSMNEPSSPRVFLRSLVLEELKLAQSMQSSDLSVLMHVLMHQRGKEMPERLGGADSLLSLSASERWKRAVKIPEGRLSPQKERTEPKWQFGNVREIHVVGLGSLTDHHSKRQRLRINQLAVSLCLSSSERRLVFFDPSFNDSDIELLHSFGAEVVVGGWTGGDLEALMNRSSSSQCSLLYMPCCPRSIHGILAKALLNREGGIYTALLSNSWSSMIESAALLTLQEDTDDSCSWENASENSLERDATEILRQVKSNGLVQEIPVLSGEVAMALHLFLSS